MIMKNLQEMINESSCVCQAVTRGNTEEISDYDDGGYDKLYMGYRDRDGYYIEASGEGSAVATIKYCPFCGRKLK